MINEQQKNPGKNVTAMAVNTKSYPASFANVST
jgi:hypothetical protein